MSDAENARLDRIETLLKQLLADKTPAAGQASYSAADFGRLVGRSVRWVRGKVAIGAIPHVRVAGTCKVLIPASALEVFRTGKPKLF